MPARTASLVKIALALAAVIAGAGGCKASVSIGGDKAIAKAEVERGTAEQLAAQQNLPKPEVTCPADLVAKVGATLDCYLMAQGETQRYPVHIEVDSVSGGSNAHYKISVGDAPIADSTTSTP